MANLSAFMSGGSSSKRFVMLTMFQSNTTWTVPATGLYRISAIGGGGGVNYKANSDTSATRSCGGGGGGFCQSLLSLTAGQSFTLAFNTNANGVYYGKDSVFSGNGTTMTAYGGAAGSRSTSIAAVSAAGGTASGGTLFNVTGGTTTCSGAPYTTGGGGVGIRGISPDNTNNNFGTGCFGPNSPYACGNLVFTNNNNYTESATPYILDDGMLWNPLGSAGVAGGTGYWGGGGLYSGGANSLNAGNGGWFGGGGALITSISTNSQFGSALGGIGGGTGGVYNSGSYTVRASNAGQTGAIFIEQQV